MSTNRAALTCRRPPPNLQHRTYPLLALMFEFLKELTEGKVRDLFAKEGFHTPKVQVFKEQHIKLLAQLYRKFPMVVCSLVRSFLVDTGNVLAFTFTVIRAFDLENVTVVLSPTYPRSVCRT